MDGNPYARMLSVIRGEASDQSVTGETKLAGLGANPCKMRLGKVTQREPLKLTVAGIEQPTEVLYINERLVKGAEWKVKITSQTSDYNNLTGYHTTPAGREDILDGQIHSTDTTIDEATTEQLEIDLEVGDQVLLLTEDDQTFFILMKVVNAV